MVTWTLPRRPKIGALTRFRSGHREREYTEARETEKQRIEQRLAQSRQAVFRVPLGVAPSEGEVAQIFSSYRGAWSSVLAATQSPGSPQEAQQKLEEIMGQARRTGDHLLERAAYHRAVDLGIQEVVDTFLEGRPKDAAAWQRYTEAAQEAEQAISFEALFATGMTDRQFAS
jgi:hypothetical protein